MSERTGWMRIQPMQRIDRGWFQIIENTKGSEILHDEGFTRFPESLLIVSLARALSEQGKRIDLLVNPTDFDNSLYGEVELPQDDDL